MKIWIDAQLSPAIAAWLTAKFADINVEAIAIRDLGLRDEEDLVIFLAARDAGATVMTKDSDFADLQLQLGAPPRIIWLTCGNTSNMRLKNIFESQLTLAVRLLEAGDTIVEISGR